MSNLWIQMSYGAKRALREFVAWLFEWVSEQLRPETPIWKAVNELRKHLSSRYGWELVRTLTVSGIIAVVVWLYE